MELFDKYSPGMVLIIILLVILLLGQLSASIRNMKALKKDAEKPMDDIRSAIDTHGQRIGRLEQQNNDIADDLRSIHQKDVHREMADKAEQRAILALLNHALTGNNEHEMETAKDNLNSVVWGESK